MLTVRHHLASAPPRGSGSAIAEATLAGPSPAPPVTAQNRQGAHRPQLPHGRILFDGNGRVRRPFACLRGAPAAGPRQAALSGRPERIRKGRQA